MALTCPSCGNDRNFLVKTLQMHVVQVRDDTRGSERRRSPGGDRSALRRVRKGTEFLRF